MSIAYISRIKPLMSRVLMPLAYMANTAPAARLVFQVTSDDQLTLGDDLGSEGTLSIATALNLQMPRIEAPDRLIGLSVAAVAHSGGLVLGQVAVQLALQHGFQQVLEHRAKDAVCAAPLFTF